MCMLRFVTHYEAIMALRPNKMFVCVSVNSNMNQSIDDISTIAEKIYEYQVDSYFDLFPISHLDLKF